MQIKNKIIVGFVMLTSILMLLFSLYIYITYENNRERGFYERLKGKLNATKEIYDKNDTLSEKIISSIPEQSDYVFDENQQKIFSVKATNDYNFDKSFFKNVDENGEYYFHYKTPKKNYYKDGLGILFFHNGLKRYAVITAYNKSNFEMLQRLKSILIYGNLILVFLIAIAGYVLSYVVLRPLNKLVDEIKSINPNSLNLKLSERKKHDEVAVLSNSFNDLLTKINSLVETQRSFISYASHELRTPLAAISGILETSIKYDSDFNNIKKSSEQAYKELSKAITLTNELLQLTKIESIDSQIKLVPFSMLELLIDIINSNKSRNQNQEFDLFISDEYTDESDKIIVLGNEDLMKTAIDNIINNAVKYSDEKKVFIKIELNQKKEIKVSVVDKGIGIENVDLGIIYAPMTRGSNTEKKEGYGIGLTLTKKIIEIHKGRIEIKSEPNFGTQVSVFLRVQKN